MRRLVCTATIAAAVLVLSVGAAVAKPGRLGSSKTVTVSYFTFSAAPDHLNTLNALIKIFEKKHPNIRINMQTAPYAQYFTKLQTLIAGGQAPDTFELDYGSFYGYASSGTLLNLSKASKADASFNAGIFYPITPSTEGGELYQQAFAEGTAIDRDEWQAGAFTLLMNCARDQFFSGS